MVPRVRRETATGQQPTQRQPKNMPKTDSKAFLDALRRSGKEFQDCIASLEDQLDSPLKEKFCEVRDRVSVMLAGLPDSADNDTLSEEAQKTTEAFVASLKIISALAAAVQKPASKASDQAKRKIGLC